MSWLRVPRAVRKVWLKLTMEPVRSSHLVSVGYSRRKQQLTVGFRSGATYLYQNVPEPVYQALMAAGSKGRYFARAIRTSYPYQRII